MGKVITYANNYLRLAINGTDVTTAAGPSASFFSPSVATGQQFNDLRFAKVNTQIDMIPIQLLDMQVIDGSVTQSELNRLSLQ